METHIVNSTSEMSGTEESLFSRVKGEEKIRLVDSDEETGLELYCYNNCNNDESTFIKQSRGLVFHNGELVMKAFSYTDEYSYTDENIPTILSDLSQWRFYTAYEGALLRLFYFSGRWFLSTHRKLNAFRSKWASRESFGTLFKKALEREAEINETFSSSLGEGDNILVKFENSLDKRKQYMFLLRNFSDNRIVCDVPQNTESLLLHVGTFIDGELSLSERLTLKSPDPHEFKSTEEIKEYIATNIDPKKAQGIICFGPECRQIKIFHSDYMELFQTRGNEPSIKFRYLQVRMNKKMTETLYSLYPESKEAFNDYEATLYDIARCIYRAYVQRFIKKRYVTVPVEEYQVIKECHSWHLSNRETNRISLERVITYLNKQSPTNLNHMIRRFKIEQAKKQEVVPRTMSSHPNSAVNSPLVIGLGGGNEPDLQEV